MKQTPISNLGLLDYARATAESRPNFYHSVCNLIKKLGPALSKDTVATYPNFFSNVLTLCPDKNLAKQTLLTLSSNHCPVCGKITYRPGVIGCSPKCAVNNPDVTSRRLATYSETQKTKKVVNTKVVVNNAELLAYIAQYQTKNPVRFGRLVQAFSAQTKSYALPRKLKEVAPKFITFGLGLVVGNSTLFKKTVLLQKSNLCPTCAAVASSPGRHCSNKCVGLDPAIIAKKESTSFKNYGVKHPATSHVVQKRSQQTMLKNHGVTHALKSEKIRAKARATMLERHGADCSGHSPAIIQKAKDTMLEKYDGLGMGHPTILAKARKTSMRNHGYRHPSQSPKVRARQARGKYKRKTFVEKNGRVHDTVQGYEPQVLEWFNSIGVNNFVTDPEKMPNIRVGRSYYLPDARFKHKGKSYLLEVKSDHTLMDQWSKNMRKFRAALAWAVTHDYTFVLAISTGKKGKPIIVTNPTVPRIKEGLVKMWTPT